MIAGAPHTADVVALRDSEILALPRGDFFTAADNDPHIMTELAQMMIVRLRQAAAGLSPAGDPSVYGFIAADAGPSIRPRRWVTSRSMLKASQADVRCRSRPAGTSFPKASPMAARRSACGGSSRA